MHLGTLQTKSQGMNATEISRQLPQNLNAECSVLGAICIDNKYLPVAALYLKLSDFFLPQNRVIFREMLDMAEEMEAIDELTISDPVFICWKATCALRSPTTLSQTVSSISKEKSRPSKMRSLASMACVSL
jgi:hypothetical protein